MVIHEAVPKESARIAELTQRTNRCTNGKRYSVANIRQSMERPLYSVHLKGRFSDLGLIGAMEIVEGRLSLFSLSCRALGREVEGRMIDFVRQRHKITEIDFVSTGKNGCLKEFFGREFPQIVLD
jgi:predicted enzyme involved in methoxymalonyl-ACP biosynthesis